MLPVKLSSSVRHGLRRSLVVPVVLLVGVEPKGPNYMRRAPVVNNITLGLINARSNVINRTDLHLTINDDEALGITAVVETCASLDAPDAVSQDLARAAFKVINKPRSHGDRGSDLTIIHRDYLSIKNDVVITLSGVCG